MSRKPAHEALVFPSGPHEVRVLVALSVTGRPPPSRLHHASYKEVVVSSSNEKLELKTARGRLFFNPVEMV